MGNAISAQSTNGGVLGVILARAGSKGLPGKCVALLRGRPLIEHTIRHALDARRLSAVCVSTDSAEAAAVARSFGLYVVDRPAELATDTAPVDAALRHAVEVYERAHPGFRAAAIVLLYGNIPVRAEGVIDRAVAHLLESRGDSVRTVAPVGKHHPDWLHRLDGDRMSPFRQNLVHRRQDLEPLYYHDGAVVAVTRAALESAAAGPEDHHAFFGRDRRAIVQCADDAVDVDTAFDLRIADAILSMRASQPGSGGSRGTIQIANREIGAGRRPFIIAEAGVNHDGDPAAALRLIEAARGAGADAVKFQAFSADRLASPDAPACDYQQRHASAESQHAMLKRLELERGAWQRLFDAGRDQGIVVFATPFGTADLEMLIELGAPAIKLASSDITNVPLLSAAARSGLPLILSTGAADAGEIDDAVARVSQAGGRDRLILLHCVSRYPTEMAEANLAAITTLRGRYGLATGFSDHTPDTATGALAVAAGAVVLEKHLTLNRNAAGPDHFFSLTPAQFADYARQARSAGAALGDGQPMCTPNQQEVRRLARGGLVAVRDIPAGIALSATDLAVRRPAVGIEAAHWDRVIGRLALRSIPAGTRIDWAMLAPCA